MHGFGQDRPAKQKQKQKQIKKKGQTCQLKYPGTFKKS
jgi:hypothetical protein